MKGPTLRKHPGLNREIIANLLSGNAIRGILTSTPGEYLIIKGAVLLEPDRDAATMGGEAVVHRASVDFVQIVGS